ncbi:hypothetical protein QYF36_014584 [Acer negundo]|nr:hypothetical protein QYF36_014584 [Acer negundo]
MEEIFMFSSQPVQEGIAILKEKPPDPRLSVKRARSQNDVDGVETQVSYSRTGRNNVVSSYAGRRNGTSIYSGKIDNGNRNVSGTSGYGAGKPRKDEEGRIESGKGVGGTNSRKVKAEKNGGEEGEKLKDNVTKKTCFNKSFKETVPHKRVVGKGRNSNKEKAHMLDLLTSDMEEVLEDSNVLKSLHKEVMGVVGTDYQSLPLKCNSTEAGRLIPILRW